MREREDRHKREKRNKREETERQRQKAMEKLTEDKEDKRGSFLCREQESTLTWAEKIPSRLSIQTQP